MFSSSIGIIFKSLSGVSTFVVRRIDIPASLSTELTFRMCLIATSEIVVVYKSHASESYSYSGSCYS